MSKSQDSGMIKYGNHGCPSCGSQDTVIKTGTETTDDGVFNKFKCGSCSHQWRMSAV